ncbi:MAG: helix-turn-helix transcriptional regulator [Actinomyces sp.]|nr:helix-turn-helix transcriptional regulator [Actinomyces sp.]
MRITFKPLWKLLIDRYMTREDLRRDTGLSPATIGKLSKDGNVTTNVLLRICQTLQYNLEDIVEIVPETANEEMPA